MTTTLTIDENYYVNVQELMTKSLPYPKHRSNVIVNDGEWLPIVRVTAWI